MQTMRRKPSLFVVKTLLGPPAFWARYPDVMPGLDPGIQGNTQAPLVPDRRVEPGDDDERGLAQRRRDIAAVDRLDMARGLARLGERHESLCHVVGGDLAVQ